MRNGKPEFTESDAGGGAPDYAPVADAATFLACQGRRRAEGKPLRPCDHAYGRSVSRLFDTVIPGLPIDADPPQTFPPAVPFAHVIERVLRCLDIAASPFLDAVAESWARILPPEIARDTRPARWDRGILYVAVPTSVRLFELRRTAHAAIRQAVRDFATDTPVRDVHLMLDTAPATSEQKKGDTP